MKFLLLATLILLSLTAFAQDTALVLEVIDGNTLELASGGTVRLIGIDATKEAYEFIKRRAQGKTIRLEFDEQQRDEEERLLAYVYVTTRFNEIIGGYDDAYRKEIFLNAEVIKKGYTRPLPDSTNNKYTDLFQKLYQEKRENNKSRF